MRRWFWAALAVAVVGGGRADDKPKKAETKAEAAVRVALDNLQGLWRGETLVEDGKEAAARAVKRKTIFIGGDRLMVRDRNEVAQAGQLTFDPKTPGSIDLKVLAGPLRNITMLGIYELKGDTLKTCFDTAGRERPKEFKSEPASGITVATYKRDKPRQGPDPSGAYDCEGREVDGSPYTAKVEIRRVGDAFGVTWVRPQGLTALGVGLVRGSVLSVSFAGKEMAGIAVYQIGKDGKLEGDWTDVGGIGILRTETLTPAK